MAKEGKSLFLLSNKGIGSASKAQLNGHVSHYSNQLGHGALIIMMTFLQITFIFGLPKSSQGHQIS